MHHIAQVRQPDEEDTLFAGHVDGARIGCGGQSVAMIRRISTKLLLAVLAAVVLPFLGFTLFVTSTMAERLSRDVVVFSLESLAADLAGRIDRRIEQFRGDVRFLASVDYNAWAIEERDNRPEERTFRPLLEGNLDAAVQVKRSFDLFLLVDYSGRLVASNRLDSNGRPLPAQTLQALAQRSFANEAWFLDAFRGSFHAQDWHRSDLLGEPDATAPAGATDHHIGFACPVYSDVQLDQVVGVLYGLVSWSAIQDDVEQPVLKSYFQGLVGERGYSSAYAWVWAADADTILAHDDPKLYGERVSGPRIDLPQMVAAARAAERGLYPEYTFRGQRKTAAFMHTAPPERGGFDWVVGVGIDNEDIFRAVRELQSLLLKSTLAVLCVAVLLTMVVARRTTAPILSLHAQTQRVAAGDLDAHVEVESSDELGELAAAFNRMTADLKLSREREIKAQKDAAWREMARQIAHDIKNPLTPIQLSVDLLKRAHDEQSPQFEALFERTIDTVRRQVAHLRDIASDFHALTGVAQARPERVELGALCDDVLGLNAAWAEERGVQVTRAGAGGFVRADPGLLRRVLMNLVSNALEAMPDGGALDVRVERVGARVRLEVTDSGAGVPQDVRARLFEPYFTTRTSGTGLGLAIAKRVVEDAGGGIALEPARPGPGTVARVELPADDGDAA
ncbi:MAG TPA: ATP-binding protein [Planctomycetota bacterium]|nr:ATP-binding protein [Planctomycetota bacterium]